MNDEVINENKKVFYDTFEKQGFHSCSNVSASVVRHIQREDDIEFKVFLRLLSDHKTIRLYVGDVDNLYIDSIELFETDDWNKVIQVINLLSQR